MSGPFFEDEPDEMEEWMQVWQENVEPIDALREDFVRRARKDVVGTKAVLATVLGGLAALIALALWRGSWMPMAAFVIVAPYALYSVRHIHRITRHYHTAPPLTPRGYLEVMRLNLEIKRRYHAFDQSMFPYAVLFPGAVIALVLYMTDRPLFTLALVFGVVAPAYAYAFYQSFYRAPQKLEEERQRLAEIERELRE